IESRCELAKTLKFSSCNTVATTSNLSCQTSVSLTTSGANANVRAMYIQLLSYSNHMTKASLVYRLATHVFLFINVFIKNVLCPLDECILTPAQVAVAGIIGSAFVLIPVGQVKFGHV